MITINFWDDSLPSISYTELVELKVPLLPNQQMPPRLNYLTVDKPTLEEGLLGMTTFHAGVLPRIKMQREKEDGPAWDVTRSIFHDERHIKPEKTIYRCLVEDWSHSKMGKLMSREPMTSNRMLHMLEKYYQVIGDIFVHYAAIYSSEEGVLTSNAYNEILQRCYLLDGPEKVNAAGATYSSMSSVSSTQQSVKVISGLPRANSKNLGLPKANSKSTLLHRSRNNSISLNPMIGLEENDSALIGEMLKANSFPNESFESSDEKDTTSNHMETKHLPVTSTSSGGFASHGTAQDRHRTSKFGELLLKHDSKDVNTDEQPMPLHPGPKDLLSTVGVQDARRRTSLKEMAVTAALSAPSNHLLPIPVVASLANLTQAVADHRSGHVVTTGRTEISGIDQSHVLPNVKCRRTDADMIFISNCITGPKHELNSRRSLLRFQFLDSLIDLARVLYNVKLPSTSLRKQRANSDVIEDPFGSCGVIEAMEKFIIEVVVPCAERNDWVLFNKQVLLTEPIDTVLRKNMGIYEKVFKRFSGLENLPSESKCMCFKEWLELCEKSGIILSLGERLVRLAFWRAKVPVAHCLPEDLSRNLFFFKQLTQAEFLEALVHVAHAKCVTYSLIPENLHDAEHPGMVESTAALVANSLTEISEVLVTK